MNIKFFFQFVQLFIFIIIYSCSHENMSKKTVPQAVMGLCSPIQLSVEGLNKIDLSDFFLEKYDIDSVYFELEKLDLDSVYIELNPKKLNTFLSTLTVYIDNITYDLLVKASDVQETTILFQTSAEDVKIKGEFTNWVAVPMKKVGDTYKFTKHLNPAVYQFCFVVDGKEQLDNRYDYVPNGLGGENCKITVPSKRIDNPSLNFEFNEVGDVVLKPSEGDVNLLVFYENQLIQQFDSTEKGVIPQIPHYSNQMDLSYLRAWAHSKTGYSSEVLIPFVNGKAVQNPSILPRQAKHRMALYNVFVDRFYDGDTTNQPRPLDSVLPQAQYLGGDLKGLSHQLNKGYFDSLAINTIWISPLVDQAKGAWGLWKTPRSKFSAYHGYWPTSFTQINPAFGTKNDFKTCISTAHQKNMNVLLDVVANHIHIDHLLYQSNPEYFTSLYLPDGTMNTEKWDEHRLTTWFDVHMPSFNHEIESVRELLSDSLMNLVHEYQFDGFRHDATKHVPSSFWKLLTKKIKNQYQYESNREFFQIGETYGSHKLVGSYVNSGQLDAQFDFNVYDAIMKVLCDDASFNVFTDVIDKSIATYGDHHLMGNITGNQDKGRSISYFGGALKRDEDAKLAGWTRKIGHGDEEMAFKKMTMMHVLNSTIPGIPVIFYGDEIGMPGGNDPDCRRMMKFQNLTQKEQELKDEVSHLLKFRNSSMALLYGTMSWHEITEHRLVYSREYGNEVVTVYLNKSKSNQEFEHDGLKFVLFPYTYKIFKDNS
mgnify:FL=1